MEPQDAGAAGVEQELRRFPPPVIEEYWRASPPVQGKLSGREFLAWGQQGAAIAQKAVRSWEAASEYFRASPRVLETLPFSQFLQWAQNGDALCQDSTTACVAFFRASPATLITLDPMHISGWSRLGRTLYKGTWKSGALSATFFELSPDLLSYLSFRELELFVALVENLSQRSYDLATECLQLGRRVFPLVPDDRMGLIALATALSQQSWREVKGCFEAVPKVAASVERSQRVRFLLLGERLARIGISNVPHFLLEGSLALGKMEKQQHERVMDLAEVLLRHSPEAVIAFLKSAPSVRERVSDLQFETWFNEGLVLLRQNTERGLAYFRLESSRAHRTLDNLSASVELGRIHGVMQRYCQALAGATVDIQPTSELVGKGIGWVSNEHPTTDGTRVFLPPVVDRYSAKEDNFGWFKVVGTHQVAHLEFGSFQFQFDRPASQFTDLRPLVASGQLDLLEAGISAPGAEMVQITASQATGASPTTGRDSLTDMSRFFDLFPDKKLALDIFTAVEDGRLDFLVLRDYRGITPMYRRVQQDALRERPPLEAMPLQQAMVELLVRLSLDRAAPLSVPRQYRREAKTIVATARRVMRPGTTVEDSVEATLRIYALISRMPNQEVPPDQWESQDTEDPEFSEEELRELLAQLRGQGTSRDEQESQTYQSPGRVEFRGDFKPEITQLLAWLKQREAGQGKSAQGQEMLREHLERLLEHSAELEAQAQEGRAATSNSQYAANLLREAGLQQQGDQPTLGNWPIPHEEEQGGPLESREPMTFVYDEWDFRADDYKPRWCVVREKPTTEGEPHFFTETLRAHAGLMAQIRRQFELVVPETFRKIRPLKEGEDVELDAAIEATIDRRAGHTPSEKVYWRRNKIERDVAVVFLLDMSASTAEAIDESRRLGGDWDVPDDPVEYMMWLRSRHGQGTRRPYKRIIDIEKESLVLLTTALEAVGDVYGVYGFSGYGRENVEFYVIKDIEEGFSEHVKKRIDKITPLHATRMGPAIRHATSKLDHQDARTKILFLISDGRPQDRGYSREGVEKEYAVHDTKMALNEARRSNITPFCLTVDKSGHDYLKTMCSDMGYEVLHDVTTLPRRLPLLYRRLTI